MIFQSTLPARGATAVLIVMNHVPQDFNPRSPHGERRKCVGDGKCEYNISIHAPRTGSDHAVAVLVAVSADFNPRSPHGERPGTTAPTATYGQFQSTLPARGATIAAATGYIGQGISIHAPRTGSDGNADEMTAASRISIHAPRTGSDLRG